MARKATDLLDVFRFRAEDEDEGKGKGGTGRSPPPRRGAKPPRERRTPRRPGGFEGVSLNRRQVLMAGSALVLLLILSFTLGLATGRPGSGGSDQALQRTQDTRVVIRARLPVVDPATRKAVQAAQVARDLAKDYQIPAANLQVRLEGSDLIVEIGPFLSRERARSYLRSSGLEMAHLHMGDPFRFAEFPPYLWDR